MRPRPPYLDPHALILYVFISNQPYAQRGETDISAYAPHQRCTLHADPTACIKLRCFLRPHPPMALLVDPVAIVRAMGHIHHDIHDIINIHHNPTLSMNLLNINVFPLSTSLHGSGGSNGRRGSNGGATLHRRYARCIPGSMTLICPFIWSACLYGSGGSNRRLENNETPKITCIISYANLDLFMLLTYFLLPYRRTAQGMGPIYIRLTCRPSTLETRTMSTAPNAVI